MSSRKEVYPISENLREQIQEQLTHNGLGSLEKQTDSSSLGALKQMVETLGEYEHGAAEIEDVLPELWEELTAEKLNVAMDDDEEYEIRKEAEQKLLRAAAAVIYEMSLVIISQS